MAEAAFDPDAILHLLPRAGAATPLYLFLHGQGATSLAMTPVADRFAQAYPQAAHLIPDGFLDAGSAGTRQWFDASGGPPTPSALAAAIERLAALVRAAQQHFALAPVATALVGFAQGATLALEAAQARAGLVGRVVAIGGRYLTLPERAPDSVIHLVHGKDDGAVPARHSVEAATRLIALRGDVTADVVPGIGHEPHPELVDRALGHLQTFLPRRVWEEALAEAPLLATRADSRELDRPLAANDPKGGEMGDGR